MYAEHEISNALQHQKDYLLDMLSNAIEPHPDWINCATVKDTQMVITMIAILQCNQELWCALGYGYKGAEIATRIIDAARQSQDNLHHAAHKQARDLKWIITNTNKLLDLFNARPVL